MSRFQDTGGQDLPTLLEYYLQGYRHLRVHCLYAACNYAGFVEIAKYLERRPGVPVNKLGWTCKYQHDHSRVNITPVRETMCGACAQADWVRPR